MYILEGKESLRNFKNVDAAKFRIANIVTTQCLRYI